MTRKSSSFKEKINFVLNCNKLKDNALTRQNFKRAYEVLSSFDTIENHLEAHFVLNYIKSDDATIRQNFKVS